MTNGSRPAGPPIGQTEAPVPPHRQTWADAYAQAQADIANQPLTPRPPTQVVINGHDHGYLPGALPDYQTPLPPGYGAAPTNLSELPNYDKLTAGERWAMNRLPGILDYGVGGLTVGKALEWFGNSLPGKMLAYLDVGAEAVERGAGFAQQWREANADGDGEQFWKDWRAAWYAGSLTYDTSNLTPSYDANLQRFALPTDLPGSAAGLAAARSRIVDLTAQGMDYTQALNLARAEYLDSLGALAIRAQIQDTALHIVADPINLIAPYIKPVERLQVLKQFLAGTKVTAAGLESIQTSARAVEAAAEAARLANRVDELPALERAAAEWAEQLAYANRTRLSAVEQKFLDVMNFATGPRQTGLLRPLNLFQLTDAARAHDYLSTVLTNVQTRLIPLSGTPEEALRNIMRIARGTEGPQLAHMLATTEGRTVRALAVKLADEAQSALETLRAVQPSRDTLDLLARALDTSVYDVMKRHAAGETLQMFDQLRSKLAATPELAAALDRLLASQGLTRAQLTAEILAGRLDVFRGTSRFFDAGLISDEVIKFDLINRVADAAAQQALVQFGVKARGFLEAAADTLKRAESLALLRLNPSYPIRNLLNNTLTLVARGAWNWQSAADINKFWQRLGFEPARLRESFTLADVSRAVETGQGTVRVAGAALGRADTIITDAVRGERGWLERAVDRLVDGVSGKLGRLDGGKLARGFEEGASVRAMTTGYQKGWRYFWTDRAPKVADLNPADARVLGPDAVRALQGHVRSVLSEEDLGRIYTDDLSGAAAYVVDAVEQELGARVDDILGPEFQTVLRDELMPAARQGEAALDAALGNVRAARDLHVQGLHDEALSVLAAETAARMETMGPGGWVALMADQVDEFWGAHIRGGQDISARAESIQALTSAAEAHAAWRASEVNQAAFWQRIWDRYETRLKAVARAGQGVDASAVTAAFKGWRDTWGDFFKARGKLYGDFFTARLEGKPPKKDWATITNELDAAYTSALEAEQRFTRGIDQATAKLLPPEQRGLYSAVRDRIAAFRLEDKQRVLDFRREVRKLPATERPDAFKAHWQERIELWTRTWQEERRGYAALQGNPQAAEAYTDAAVALQADFRMFDDLGAKLVQGQELTIEEAVELARLIDRYALPDEAAALRQLDADEAADLLNPPRVPTPEGVRMLDEEFRAAAAYDISEDAVASSFTAALNKKWFRVQNGEVLGKTVWRNSETGQWRPWSLKPPDDMGKWVKTSGNEVDGWIEEAYRNITGGLGGDDKTAFEMWDELVRGRAAWQKYRQKAAVKPAADIPTVVDEAALAARRAEREADRQAIQAQVYARMYEQADTLAEAGRVSGAPPGLPNDLPTLPNFDDAVTPELYPSVGLGELWATRGEDALAAVRRTALDEAARPPVRIANLTADQQAAARRYIEAARSRLGEARYNSVKFAEFMRDSALLNYNRRFNYNTFLGMIFPYEFWFTQSAFKWALHSIDRPAMLSTYLRFRKFMETGYRPESGQTPSRFRGSVRVALPFLPEWMGDAFVDPFQAALPFDSWGGAFEMRDAQETRDEGAARRKLEELLNDQQISELDYARALQTQAGPAWERALALAQTDDAEGRFTDADFVFNFLSPHPPLLWAYDAARGRQTPSGAVLPLTRTIGGVANMLGIDPAGPYNPEAALRKHFGLHPFDRWDDYRVERMLANMAATGEITPFQARLAMIDQAGDVWDAAQRKAYAEKFGGAYGLMGSVVGLPVRFYPEGERHLRALADDYQRAWRAYEAGDLQAINRFNDEFPEYEARLALYKPPEERLQQFLVDEIWNIWNDLPKVNRDEVKDQLGAQFVDQFLTRETRAYDSISPETLGLWLQLLGGETPGRLEAAAPGSLAYLDLTERGLAEKAQTFYNLRSQMFPYSWDASEEYFALEEGAARRDYLKAHPELKLYFAWRTDWLLGNPDVAPYLDDTPPKYASEAQLDAYRAQPEPNLTPAEWMATVGTETWALAVDYADYGDDMPQVAIDRLEREMDRIGWDGGWQSFAAHMLSSRELDYGPIVP